MGHAPAAVIDAADEVTGTIEEHGVVAVLRTLTPGPVRRR
jgi:hydroxymethylpyrimidine pyrophosphatase-like HAD family hydrolase